MQHVFKVKNFPRLAISREWGEAVQTILCDEQYFVVCFLNKLLHLRSLRKLLTARNPKISKRLNRAFLCMLLLYCYYVYIVYFVNVNVRDMVLYLCVYSIKVFKGALLLTCVCFVCALRNDREEFIYM